MKTYKRMAPNMLNKFPVEILNRFILIHVHCIFLNYFVLCPTNAQLFHKLSHCYIFRHYRVILREL